MQPSHIDWLEKNLSGSGPKLARDEGEVGPYGDLGHSSGWKDTFRRHSRAYLRLLAKQAGLESETYDIRFNAGGPAVSGEATLHGERLYVQMSATSLGVLYRTCEGRKDYSGGANHWWPWRDLRDISGFAEALRNLKR